MQEQSSLPEPVRNVVTQVMKVGSRRLPFSAESWAKAPRIRDAKVIHSVCPYCAVGCGLNVNVKDGRVLDIEGNPDSPINHGTLCPKGPANNVVPASFWTIVAAMALGLLGIIFFKD